MKPFAAGIAALLFVARWPGAIPGLPGIWGDPFADLDGHGAAGRAGSILIDLAVGAIVLAGLRRPGSAVRGWLRWRGGHGRGAVTWALGVGAVAAIWEGLGLAGLIRTPIAWLTVALLGPAGIAFALREIRWQRPVPAAGWFALAVLLALPPVLAPEIEVDALAVHLALPDAWRVAGRIGADSGHGASGFPFAQEALHLPALVLGAELPARLLSLAGGILAALGASALAGMIGATSAVAWLAGAATLAMPQLFDLATRAKNDALSVGLATAALVALAPGTRAAVATAGLLAGAAAATKLTAGLVLPALGIALLAGKRNFAAAHAGSARSWLQVVAGRVPALALGAGCAVLPLLPWSLRNYVLLGSPCFPMLESVFPVTGRSGVNAELLSRYAFTWADVRPDSPWAALRDFVRIAGGYSPVILAGAILLAATRRAPSGAGRIGAFVVTAVAVWSLSLGWVSRYLLPALPAAIALAVAVVGSSGRPGMVAGGVALSLAVCAGGGSWAGRPLAAALGLESGAAYRARRLGPYPAALAVVSARVALRDRVLVAGDWRRYPSHGRLIAGMSDDEPVVRSLAVASADVGRLAVKLRQRRIRWMLHHPTQAAFWADYPMRFGWGPGAARIWGAYWDAHASLVWHSRPVRGVAGSFWLFRLDRAPGDRQFRAWLPGVEGEFARIRLLLNQPGGLDGVGSELRVLEPAFAGRPDFLARRAAVAALQGRLPDAARDLAAAARAAPDGPEHWAEWGSVPLPPADWRDPARRAERIGQLAAGSPELWSFLFNLGMPVVHPAPAVE